PALCTELHEARSDTRRVCRSPQFALLPQPRPLGPFVAPAQTFLQEANPSALPTHFHNAALPCGPLRETSPHPFETERGTLLPAQATHGRAAIAEKAPDRGGKKRRIRLASANGPANQRPGRRQGLLRTSFPLAQRRVLPQLSRIGNTIA